MYNLIFRGSLAIFAIVSMLSVPADSFAGETGNEGAFKKLLVEKSPWDVLWESFTSSGTHNMTYTTDGTTFSGILTNSSSGNPNSPMKNIKFKDGPCVVFISSKSLREYTYCRQPNGTLKGSYESSSGRTGDLTAKPAKR